MIWNSLLDPALSSRLCLTLLHSIWQVSLLAGLLWLAERCWQKNTVERHYVLHVAALLFAILAIPVTFMLVGLSASEPVVVRQAPAKTDTFPPLAKPRATAPVPVTPEMIEHRPDTEPSIPATNTTLSVADIPPVDTKASPATRSQDWLWLSTWIVACYVAGVAFMLFRLIISSICVQRLGATAERITAGPLVNSLRHLSQKWSLKVVPVLARSEQIIVPRVSGILRPMILLPASTISGLTTDELELILAHELAHIRRFDLWVNLLQRFTEAILFFNPAFWYLSHRINMLREYCCDEMTCQLKIDSTSTFESRVNYATALLHVAELAKRSMSSSDLTSLAASGKSPSEIRRRVARLFGESLQEPLPVSRGGFFGLLILGATLAIVGLISPSSAQTNQPETEPKQQAESKPAEKPVPRKKPVLYGRITDTEGKPIPDVEVQLYSGVATRFRGQKTTTDADGKYRFDPLKTGTAIILDDTPEDKRAYQHFGVQFHHPQYVPADSQSWRDLNVSLKEPEEKEFNLKMRRGGFIKGTVIDPKTGKPLPKLDLRIGNSFFLKNQRNSFMVYATTDDAGQFTTTPLFPGKYLIEINDSDYQDEFRYPKIGSAQVEAGNTTELQLTSSAEKIFQDPFQITGTAKADDGKSMIYGGVGIRLVNSDKHVRTRGGGIDGKNSFGIRFGPINRVEASETSPYGVGTHDVELFGQNQRFGHKLISRTPSEPLRITDDPNQPELEDGIRYIHPDKPVHFELVYARDPKMTRQFRLNVVDPDGKPIPDTTVEIRSDPAPKPDQIIRGQFLRDATYGPFVKTNAKGTLLFRIPHHMKRFNLSIKAPGYAPYWASWSSSIIPDEFTAILDAGWKVGGIIVDEAGKPIAGANISPSVNFKKRPGDTSRLGVGTKIITDDKGQWHFDYVPASKAEVHIDIDHPDYRPWRQRVARSEFEVKANASPSGKITLEEGLNITGSVTDENGKPIAGALVRTKFVNDIRKATTDEFGVYLISGCEPKLTRVAVTAKGRAPEVQEVEVAPQMEPVDFSLKPGGKIRVRVVDENGKGIPKASIYFQRWRGAWYNLFEFDNVNHYTDKNGIWEWDEAPLDEFQADICRPGGMQLANQKLLARAEEYVFHPPKALVISGNVIDAVTKQPIKKFRVTPGAERDNSRTRLSWNSSDSFTASDGKYQLRITRGESAHFVRIEADGYEVATSRAFKPNEESVSYDFALKPARDIAATILTAEGKPAAAAEIAVGIAGSQISIRQGRLGTRQTYATVLKSDEAGHFGIPPRNEPFQLIILHPAGFAYLKSETGPIPDPIQLTPWARIEGTFTIGKQPAAGVKLALGLNNGISSSSDEGPSIFTQNEIKTDQNGRYVFDRAFPGQTRVGRSITYMVRQGATEATSAIQIPIELKAGETKALNLGGSGRPVIGKLKPSETHTGNVVWPLAHLSAHEYFKPPTGMLPLEAINNNPRGFQAWYTAWQKSKDYPAEKVIYERYTEARSKRLDETPRINASVARDGSFRIDDVPPGEYVLSVNFYERENNPGYVGDLHFTVPPVENGFSSEAVDLGTLTLK
ncbi:carboxypeptidase regulatory-like domain-containing protein [Gimesia algae]|uniref:Regulatory protein BlaR1 n=1 Tax=Gimesia algae TaxID=2527971 RepID=A0A517V601_9PLAN|nr:carboxypeptidase regulatory-like domain-containing protein [Gimesia algae]QDT88439.1 Regulatory protein BlaR1 [Gimesia algae]